MATSRMTRLGASVVLSLVLMAGLAPAALGASPSAPIPSPTVAPTVAAIPSPAAAPVVAAPATDSKTSSAPGGCLPSSPSPAQPRLECPSQADPSTQTNAAGVVPAGTTGYHIKGRVTGTGGTPNLGDAQVLAYVHPAGTYAGYTNTAADGTYSVALPAGTYVLYFYDESLTYLHGYYESGSSGNFTIDYDSATPVTLGSSDVSGIDVQLGTGHHISGTATGTGGTPLTSIQVDADSSDYTSAVATHPDGTYSVEVPAGTYAVKFLDTSGTYLTGYYRSDGIAVDATWATPVMVDTLDVGNISVRMLVPWTLTLGASARHATVRTAVTLTATVNQDVSPTPYWIVILASDGTVLNACDGGTTCSTAVVSGAVFSDTFHAVVGAYDGTHPVKTSHSVTVTWARPATHLNVSVGVNPWPAGSKHSVTVTARDAYGDIATGYRGTIHFTTSDAQASVPADYSFTDADAGVHTFPSTSSHALRLETAGTRTVTATDVSHSSITGSHSVVVTPGVAKSFTVSVGMNPWPAGSTHSVRVTALDAYGNVATGYQGTIHFTTSDAAASVPADYTFTAADNGVHTFPNTLIPGLTLRTVGTQWVRATDTVTATITGIKTGIVVH